MSSAKRIMWPASRSRSSFGVASKSEDRRRRDRVFRPKRHVGSGTKKETRLIERRQQSSTEATYLSSGGIEVFVGNQALDDILVGLARWGVVLDERHGVAVCGIKLKLKTKSFKTRK